MSIRIETHRLIDLIQDLKLTAAQDPEQGAIAGILFHSARGPGFPGEPGQTDLLCGTSTNRIVVGHTNALASGRMTTPMLWPIHAAQTVLQVFKSKAKESKEHTVEIRLGDNTIRVEDSEQTLFGLSGEHYEFPAGDLDKYPRSLWRELEHDTPWDADRSRDKTPPLPRTDLSAAALGMFTSVAARHGGVIEFYRFHQTRPVLVAIGERYRGAIVPASWGDDKTPRAGLTPPGDVYEPDLPPVPEKTTLDPGNLLEQAAHLVITAQIATAGSVSRALRVGSPAAVALLDKLETLGVLAPARPGRAREVRVQPAQIDQVLSKIRINAAAQGGVVQERLPVEPVGG